MMLSVRSVGEVDIFDVQIVSVGLKAAAFVSILLRFEVIFQMRSNLENSYLSDLSFNQEIHISFDFFCNWTKIQLFRQVNWDFYYQPHETLTKLSHNIFKLFN